MHLHVTKLQLRFKLLQKLCGQRLFLYMGLHIKKFTTERVFMLVVISNQLLSISNFQFLSFPPSLPPIKLGASLHIYLIYFCFPLPELCIGCMRWTTQSLFSTPLQVNLSPGLPCFPFSYQPREDELLHWIGESPTMCHNYQGDT